MIFCYEEDVPRKYYRKYEREAVEDLARQIADKVEKNKKLQGVNKCGIGVVDPLKPGSAFVVYTWSSSNPNEIHFSVYR